MKGAWSGHVSHFIFLKSILNFGGHQPYISDTPEATVVKFGTQVSYIKFQHMKKNHL